MVTVSGDRVQVGDSDWLTGQLLAQGQGIGSARSPSTWTANPADGSQTTISYYGDEAIGGRGFKAMYSCEGGTSLDMSYSIGEDGHSLVSATPGAKSWQCYKPYDFSSRASTEIMQFPQISVFLCRSSFEFLLLFT